MAVVMHDTICLVSGQEKITNCWPQLGLAMLSHLLSHLNSSSQGWGAAKPCSPLRGGWWVFQRNSVKGRILAD